MNQLVRRLVDRRERAEMLERLTDIRDRLGGGFGRLSIHEWADLERKLPALSGVVARVEEDHDLEPDLRHTLIDAW